MWWFVFKPMNSYKAEKIWTTGRWCRLKNDQISVISYGLMMTAYDKSNNDSSNLFYSVEIPKGRARMGVLVGVICVLGGKESLKKATLPFISSMWDSRETWSGGGRKLGSFSSWTWSGTQRFLRTLGSS